MGLGLNITGMAAGYNAYRDEQRREEDTERRRKADEQLDKDRAYQEEQRSRQRYEWNETDRKRDASHQDDADYQAQFAQATATPAAASTPTAPTAQAASTPSAPAAGGADISPDMQTYPVADPANEITPMPMKAATGHVAPLDDSLEGAPPQRAVAIDMAAPAAAAPQAAQPAPAAAANTDAPTQAAAAPAAAAPTAEAGAPGAAAAAPGAAPAAPGLAPAAGIPQPRQMATVLGMYANRLEKAALRGDVTPQEFAQTRELLNKMQTEGVTQGMAAFARGDFPGGVALNNSMGTNKISIVPGSIQQTTTTLPTGETVPTYKLRVINSDGSRTDIDTALNQYQTMALKDRLELMDKAATRKDTAAFHTGTLAVQNRTAAAAEQNAKTNEGYRKDQAENMREQRRLQEEAIHAKAAQNAGTAPIWAKEDDSFLKEQFSSKDEMTGAKTFDGDGFQFAKQVALIRSRFNGGDAASASAYALSAYAGLKAQAAGDPAKLKQLRSEALQKLMASAQQGQGAPAAGTAPTPGAAAPSEQRTLPDQKTLAERDKRREAFNHGVYGGQARSRFEEAKSARQQSAADHFTEYLAALRPGMSAAEAQRVLGWLNEQTDAGNLSNQQLKQVREARHAAGM